jgi:hypothetical protein
MLAFRVATGTLHVLLFSDNAFDAPSPPLALGWMELMLRAVSILHSIGLLAGGSRV